MDLYLPSISPSGGRFPSTSWLLLCCHGEAYPRFQNEDFLLLRGCCSAATGRLIPEWIQHLSDPGRDHLFPEFQGSIIGDATAWLVSREPPDQHEVYGAVIYMLMLPPLSLDQDDAKKFVKLHGMRRVVLILARRFYSVPDLTVKDRNALGRWAYTSQGSMPNIYADEANRPNQIKVREGVLAHSRLIFAKFRSDYCSLDLHDSYSIAMAIE